MRVLVTGLDGFTGRYVKRELEDHGHEVVGLSANLTDAVAVRRDVGSLKFDAVIHLAGIAFVGHGDANSFYQVNLIGTRNLLEALAPHADSLQGVLLASSANVYGNRHAGVLDESLPPSPANDYAVSKLAMEYMASLWMDKLPIVITRPFNYTGVGQSIDFVIPKIVDHFRCRAGEIELGNLDVEREFSDVRMVALIYRQMIERKVRGEVFNVCNGQGYSLADVIRMMEEISGHPINIRVNPALVRANEVKRLVGSREKLRRLVGEQVQIPLRSTLEWMYREV